jgi:hypothetical protein
MPRSNEAWTRRRTAARTYQPKRVRLLLVVESPPADENRYFYFEGAAAGDDLFNEFCSVLFEEEPQQHDRVRFLKELRRRGVFLADLKPDAPRAGEALGPYVAPLLLNIDTLGPDKIILIGADAYDASYAAMKKAALPVVDVRVPFPIAGQEVSFRQKLRQALVAGLEKLIRPLPPPARDEP